jgi:hypothetical protein
MNTIIYGTQLFMKHNYLWNTIIYETQLFMEHNYL